MPSINPDLLTEFEKNLPHHGMILVEGGVFLMGGRDEAARGNETPIHKVKISDFYMGQFPVTQALYEKIIGANPSEFKGADRPIEMVNWNEAKEFLKRLNTETGKNYRLPTEAEWEFAARGGIYSEDYIYAGSDKLSEVAWYEKNSGNETHPVGQKMANELNLHDMSGNVHEWCEDWYSRDCYKINRKMGIAQNPKGPVIGKFHVMRGGSYQINARWCRVAFRESDLPEKRFSNLGFRLVLPKPQD